MAERGDKKIRVVTCGPDPGSQGGIASVLRAVGNVGYPPDVQVRHVVTHSGGSSAAKLKAAARGVGTVAWLCLRRQVDVLHLHTSTGTSFWRKTALLMVGKITDTRVILHVHGSTFDIFMASGSRLRRLLIKAALEQADLVIVLSPEWREKLLTIATARVQVVPNGVTANTRGKCQRADGPVISVGRLGRRKGTFDLIAAMSGLREANSRLVLAGDGSCTQARRAAEAAGIGDRVTVTGWLSPEKRDALLARARIFVLPSYAEGLPMALLEAMAQEMPVVVTPVGGIPQLVRDGENGLLVPPGDVEALSRRLDMLLADANLCKRLGAAARRTVEESFSTDATVASLGAVYRTLVDSDRIEQSDRPLESA
jgi:glycosyltransferase involved in cell wall biosynthesis